MDFVIDQNFILSILGLCILAIPAIGGFLKYRDSINLRRSEWLHKLYVQFYTHEDFKEIRRMLDDKTSLSELEKLIEKDERLLEEKELKKLEEFTDYCNFFEFMMSLKKSKMLEDKHIEDMFRYYLNLFSSDVIKKGLQKYGFKLLIKYLKERNTQDKNSGSQT